MPYCSAIADSLEESGDQLFTFLRYPLQQWKSLRTTNAIERLHGEFKRRIKTQCALPDAETAAMLFWALMALGRSPCSGSMVGKRWTKPLSSSRLTPPHNGVTVGIGRNAENEFSLTIGHDPKKVDRVHCARLRTGRHQNLVGGPQQARQGRKAGGLRARGRKG